MKRPGERRVSFLLDPIHLLRSIEVLICTPNLTTQTYPHSAVTALFEFQFETRFICKKCAKSPCMLHVAVCMLGAKVGMQAIHTLCTMIARNLQK